MQRLLFATSMLLVACGGSAGAEETTIATRDEAPPEARSPMSVDAPPDVAAPPADAERTASGLASRQLVPGEGASHPGPTDRVTVHYAGWTTDGELFDSSLERGEPGTFPLDGLIAGWTEGIQLMVAGERRRFWIPEELAYRGRPGRPAGMLVFDVELIGFDPAPEAPPTPTDLTEPPADAERSPSGLVSRVLRAGTGAEHPGPQATVELHYAGWRAETGELFDTSITRGETLEAPLDRLIAGFSEGVQLMVVGEQRRLWIPAALAYEGRSGPQGPLVFDIELVSIR